MAKEYAASFYKSKPWRAVRAAVLRRDLYTCNDCYNRATEVHHTIELNPDNINDPAIALNLDLLMSLCHDCHTKRTKSVTEIDNNYYFNDDGQLIYIEK